jgi:phospholipase/lecithinase/hemolysin
MVKKLHVAALAAAVTVLLSACNDEGTEATVRPPASAQVVTQVISFGDSLSDVGTYNPTTADTNPANDLPAGLTFSTKPGMMWNAHVAINFGHTLSPNRQVRFGVVGNGGEVIELGGLAYAEGGARIEEDAPNGGVVMQPIPNVGSVPVQLATSRAIRTQIDDYLTEHGNAIDEQALVLIQGGANDFFGFLGQVAQNPALANNAPAFIAATATAMVTQIGRLQAAGASRIIYSSLPDLGLTPQFRTTALAGLASQVSAGYNAAVANALSSSGVHVFDTAAFMQQVVASPSTYGFTNATTPACTSLTTPGNPASLSALICFPTTVVSPGADVTYLFADAVHPTASAHALWGMQVVQAFPSP